MHDLTKDGIDDDVREYLKLGPDFSEAPRKVPFEKIIIETEKMCKTIEDEKEANPEKAPDLEREAHRLRDKVKNLKEGKEKETQIQLNKTRRKR